MAGTIRPVVPTTGRRGTLHRTGPSGSAEVDHNAEHGSKGIFNDADAAGLVHAVKARSSFRSEVPSNAVIDAVGLLLTVTPESTAASSLGAGRSRPRPFSPMTLSASPALLELRAEGTAP
jgi:hypothetical protein